MADILEIQVDLSGSKRYEKMYKLEGSDFIFDFFSNAVDGRWYLSIYTANRVPIKGCMGIRLVKDSLLLRRVTDLNRPKGDLLVISEVEEDPSSKSLGRNSSLMYIPKEIIDGL